MAHQEFSRTIAVASSPSEAWAVLTDAEKLVGWINIVHSVHEVEHLKSYTAVLEDKVGPFRLRADIAIAVTVPVDGIAVDVEASGRDRAVGSEIRIEGRLRLAPLPDVGCEIAISGSYTVTGRAAAMGAGIVRKKGDAAIDEFTANATRALRPLAPSTGADAPQ